MSTRYSSITKVCDCFNLTRDAYYKYLKRFKLRKIVENKVIAFVKVERKLQPRMGTRKLHEELFDQFIDFTGS